MAGPGTGMNMNGADASAAAGLNTTKSNWHYTGPALPTAEAQRALGPRRQRTHRHPHGGQRMRHGADVLPADQRHPVRPSHQPRPWPATRTPAAAAGCGLRRPVSPTDYPVVYYVNPTIVAANTAARQALLTRHRSTGWSMPKRRREPRCSPRLCICCRVPCQRRPCRTDRWCSGISARIRVDRPFFRATVTSTSPGWCRAQTERRRSPLHT